MRNTFTRQVDRRDRPCRFVLRISASFASLISIAKSLRESLLFSTGNYTQTHLGSMRGSLVILVHRTFSSTSVWHPCINASQTVLTSSRRESASQLPGSTACHQIWQPHNVNHSFSHSSLHGDVSGLGGTSRNPKLLPYWYDMLSSLTLGPIDKKTRPSLQVSSFLMNEILHARRTYGTSSVLN